MKLESAIGMLLITAAFLILVMVWLNSDKTIKIQLEHSGAVTCYDYNVN